MWPLFRIDLESDVARLDKSNDEAKLESKET